MADTIARVEAFPVAYPEPHDSGRMRYLTLVRIETSDGAVGWGECIAQWGEAALAAKVAIDRGLAELVVGRSALDPRAIHRELRRRIFWTGHGGVMSFAISGIDIALWDLAGKLRGVPVSELIGGRIHERFRACASVILDTLDLDRTADEFAGYRARGYTAVKGGWGQVPEAGFGTDPRRDVAVADTVRRAVGDSALIALDVSAYAGWTPDHACRMARELEPFRLGWLEDALPHTDLAGYRRLRSATTTALATGERCWTTADYARLCEIGAIDMLLLDPGRIEGVSGMLEAATLAGAAGIRVVPHSWSSAINTAAALQVFAAVANSFIFELKPNPSPMQHELVSTPFDQVEGWIDVPDRPGLGIEVDHGVVRRYAYA